MGMTACTTLSLEVPYGIDSHSEENRPHTHPPSWRLVTIFPSGKLDLSKYFFFLNQYNN